MLSWSNNEMQNKYILSYQQSCRDIQEKFRCTALCPGQLLLHWIQIIWSNYLIISVQFYKADNFPGFHYYQFCLIYNTAEI